MELKKIMQSLQAACVSAGLFTICMTLLAFVFERSELKFAPLFVIFGIGVVLNMIGLTAIQIYMEHFRDKNPVREINESLSSDEKARNMFNWSLGYGMAVTLLVVIIYAISTEISRGLPFDYTFLLFALMPVAPWTGRTAIDHFNELIDETPLSACFFHLGKPET